MQQYQNVLQDKFGNVIVGASVAVYVYGTTTPATIYSGNGTGLLPSNTVTTSSLGEFAFYAANGRYSLSITATNFALENYSDFILYDPADIGAVTASGVAFTPFGTVSATNVQNAIQEVVTDLSASSGASTVGFAPTGTIAATTVQTAISEVVTDLSASSGSSLVGFLQSGTGAVARTVQAKERDVVSVKDFGAVGNGIADDTAAIQAAITAANAVYFPAGTYLTNTLTLDSSSTLFGDGASSILKQNTITGSSYGTLYANSGASGSTVNNIVVRDLRIEGPNIVTPVFSEFQHLASFNGVNNLVVERVQFIGFRGDGLLIGSGVTAGDERHNTNVIVRDCFFDGINKENRNGISVIDVNGILIEGCYFTRCSKSTMPGAIDIEPDAQVFHVIKDIRIVNNRFYDIGGNVSAISIPLPNVTFTTSPYGFVIGGNYIDTAAGAGIIFQHALTGGVTESTPNYGVRIFDNVIKTVAKPFAITNAKDIVIHNNSFLGSTLDAIVSYNTSDYNAFDVTISENLFYACGSTGGNGLSIFKCSRVTINGNTFKDCGTGGAGTSNAIDFNTGTSSYVVITNNIFTSPAAKTLVAVQKEAGHTFTASTNVWMDNPLANSITYGSFDATYNDTAEQTYSPTVTGATTAGTGSYTIQYGRWRRIGKMIFFRTKVTVSAGHTGTGIIQVELPTAAVAAPNNEETAVALIATGVVTTGGHTGLINPAVTIGSNGAVRCYSTAAGTITGVTIPAGAFTVNVAGFYQAA